MCVGLTLRPTFFGIFLSGGGFFSVFLYFPLLCVDVFAFLCNFLWTCVLCVHVCTCVCVLTSVSEREKGRETVKPTGFFSKCTEFAGDRNAL